MNAPPKLKSSRSELAISYQYYLQWRGFGTKSIFCIIALETKKNERNKGSHQTKTNCKTKALCGELTNESGGHRCDRTSIQSIASNYSFATVKNPQNRVTRFDPDRFGDPYSVVLGSIQQRRQTGKSPRERERAKKLTRNTVIVCRNRGLLSGNGTGFGVFFRYSFRVVTCFGQIEPAPTSASWWMDDNWS